MSAYRISKNVPLPARQGSLFPWRSMEVGDSFFVPASAAGVDGKRVYLSAANFRRRAGNQVRFSVRKVPGGYRAWRVAL